MQNLQFQVKESDAGEPLGEGLVRVRLDVNDDVIQVLNPNHIGINSLAVFGGEGHSYCQVKKISFEVHSNFLNCITFNAVSCTYRLSI